MKKEEPGWGFVKKGLWAGGGVVGRSECVFAEITEKGLWAA